MFVNNRLPKVSRKELDRRADKFLAEIQKELMPEHAAEFLAINLETGDYILSATPSELDDAFDQRWPNHLMFCCRVDGGPVVKFRTPIVKSRGKKRA